MAVLPSAGLLRCAAEPRTAAARRPGGGGPPVSCQLIDSSLINSARAPAAPLSRKAPAAATPSRQRPAKTCPLSTRPELHGARCPQSRFRSAPAACMAARVTLLGRGGSSGDEGDTSSIGVEAGAGFAARAAGGGVKGSAAAPESRRLGPAAADDDGPAADPRLRL